MKRLLFVLTILSVWMSSSLLAQRVVTDQLGKQVTIPDVVNRVVVLDHHSLNIVNELNGMSKVVGVLSSWRKRLGKNYVRLAPMLDKMPMPGDLKSVNIESILALKPDVVIVTHFLPKEFITQMEKMHIPVVAISLFRASADQIKKFNPTLKEVANTYDNGLYDSVTLIGKVLNHEKEAKELIAYTKKGQANFAKMMKKVDLSHPTKVFMARPNMFTYGSGKYVGMMLKRVGALNVAAANIKGYQQVSMENVLAWDPSVILIQSRYASVYKQIKDNRHWDAVSAVKNNRVYVMPEYAKAWGHAMPESLAVGELWMAKQLYPSVFKDVDTHKLANDFYKKFYRTTYDLNN